MTDARPTSTQSTLRALGVGLLCAKVVLVPLFFDPAALVVFAQPKALVSQALGLLLLSVLVALLLTGERPRRDRSLRLLPVGLLALAYIASAAFAVDRNVALYGAHDRSLGLLAILDVLLTFVALGWLVTSPRAVRAVAIALFVTPLALLAYQAVQMLGLDPLPWASGFGRGRPFASMGNAAVLAQYLGTLAPAAGALALIPSGLARRERLILSALAFLFAAGAILTGTRAVVLGLGAGALPVALFWIATRESRLARIRLGAAITALLIAGTVAVFTTPLARAVQTVLIGAPSLVPDGTVAPEGSVSGRLIIYQVAAAELIARPLFGVGPDNYVAGFPSFRPELATIALGSDAPQTSPHSWLAKLATDAGIAGLLAFAAVLALAAMRALLAPVHLRALAVAGAAGAASFLSTGLVSINDVGTEWLLWFALAAMIRPALVPAGIGEAAPVLTKRRRGPRASARRPEPKWPFAAVGLAAILALTTYRALDAAHAAETARQARARGDSAIAIASAVRATEVDPLRAEYWNGRGLGLTRVRDFRAAESAFERAVELVPYQFIYLTNLSRAQLSLGDPAARSRSLVSAERAVQMDPNNAETHYTLALVLAASGRSADAVSAIERAVQLKPDPSDRFFHETAATAYLAAGRAQDAERWARYGLVRVGGTREAFDTRVLLSRALLAQGRRAEALSEVQRVLDEDPAHAAAVRLRAQIQSGT